MCPLFQGSQQNRINPSESRIFWLALILCPLLWSVFFVVALFGFKFKWLLLVCIANLLSGANLYGYVKCKMGKDQNISTATKDFLRKQVMQNVSETFHVSESSVGKGDKIFKFRWFSLMRSQVMASMMTKSPPTTTPSQQANII